MQSECADNFAESVLSDHESQFAEDEELQPALRELVACCAALLASSEVSDLGALPLFEFLHQKETCTDCECKISAPTRCFSL